MTTLHLRKSIGRSPLRRGLLLIPLALVCFGLSPRAQAVTPAPDGAYPGFNTAEGTNALFSLSSGVWNTALGGQALFKDTTGSVNTAVGLNALYSNTTGSQNVAIGTQALQSSTSSGNTATGYAALFSNTIGDANTANGAFALVNNTTGFDNVAVGWEALVSNTGGHFNTATGFQALFRNTTGHSNTADGVGAIHSNADGSFNVAMGGFVGLNIIHGNSNIYIGYGVSGPSDESATTRIGNIGSTAYNPGRYVQVDAAGKLGYVVSSRRYKHDINPMDEASEALFALKPVTFRYNGDIDPAHQKMFGLIAEEVDKVSPDLVVRNQKGEPETVRFDSINAMLLNEFLKEHRKVQELEATATQQQQAIKALTASLKEQASKIQKVSAQLEVSKTAPQTVLNNQ